MNVLRIVVIHFDVVTIFWRNYFSFVLDIHSLNNCIYMGGARLYFRHRMFKIGSVHLKTVSKCRGLSHQKSSCASNSMSKRYEKLLANELPAPLGLRHQLSIFVIRKIFRKISLEIARSDVHEDLINCHHQSFISVINFQKLWVRNNKDQYNCSILWNFLIFVHVQNS